MNSSCTVPTVTRLTLLMSHSFISFDPFIVAFNVVEDLLNKFVLVICYIIVAVKSRNHSRFLSKLRQKKANVDFIEKLESSNGFLCYSLFKKKTHLKISLRRRFHIHVYVKNNILLTFCLCLVCET